MCIFCEIVKGNIPSSKVYEDERSIGILDISQATKGHTLIIPKKHYDNILDMPDDEYAALMLKAKETAHKLKKLNPNGFNILSNINPAAGQSVMHAHIHIIPRYDENDGISIDFKENKEDLEKILSVINS
ncbi:MAG: HIT family protein [Erysipelotrichaceae bacterium]|nr:HIT family protein [Erysipelotrichaceae bacterium]